MVLIFLRGRGRSTTAWVYLVYCFYIYEDLGGFLKFRWWWVELKSPSYWEASYWWLLPITKEKSGVIWHLNFQPSNCRFQIFGSLIGDIHTETVLSSTFIFYYIILHSLYYNLVFILQPSIEQPFQNKFTFQIIELAKFDVRTWPLE